MHPYVRKKINLLLNMLAEEGEEKTFRYAKRYMKEYKKYLKRQEYKKKLKKKLEKKYNDKAVRSLNKKYVRRIKRDRMGTRVSACLESIFNEIKNLRLK